MASSFKIKVRYVKHRLDFKFDAGTSRGVLKAKDTYFVRVSSDRYSGCFGYGEAGPLPKLSIDDVSDFEDKLASLCKGLTGSSAPETEECILNWLGEKVPGDLPSVRFALETALLDLVSGGKRKIFPNSFYDSQEAIVINGLIWMGDRDFMLEQIRDKLAAGFTCIKMKIGSIDFDQECALLATIRRKYTSEQVVLRVDANGAFSTTEALAKLHRLSELDIHSIEQPIKQGQRDAIKALAQESPVPIALDEELIGILSLEEKERLLDEIRPQYIILKPTLVGGIKSTREWIHLAQDRCIGWWMTSALESNIGLNAIAQLASTYHPAIPQGLGTGQLYYNNIDSPLAVEGGRIFYRHETPWGDVESLFGE